MPINFRGSAVSSVDGQTGVVNLSTRYIQGIQAKSRGLVGDGVTNDSPAWTALLTSLTGPTQYVVEFDDGNYELDPFVLPYNVSIMGRSRKAKLGNRSTSGGRFITQTGSKTFIRRMTIDFRRDSQTSGAISGWAAIVASLPSSVTGGSESLAGGLLLTGTASAGATSISVTTASPGGVPIQPGDMINLRLPSAGAWERVLVAPTYSGGTTIPLQSPLINTYTIAAKVTLCITSAFIEDCTIFGQVSAGGGISDWRVRNNVLLDAPDTCLGIFEQGSKDVMFTDNLIRTPGHWAVVVDGLNDSYPPSEDTVIRGNHIFVLSGASDYSGPPFNDPASRGGIDAILLTHCQRPEVARNLIFMPNAGLRGIRVETTCSNARVNHNTIVGGGTANTYGIANVSVPANGNNDLVADNNTIFAVDYAIDFAGSVTGIARGNTIRNCVTAGINSVCPAGATTKREYVVTGNDIDGAQVGLRFTGPPTAPTGSHALTTSSNLLRNQSFVPKIFDNGWTEG